MNMDKPLRRVAIFGLLLFFGLMAQVNYMQGSQAEKLRDHDNNTRKYAEVFNSFRGQITAGGKVLASSKETGKSNPKYSRDYSSGEIFAPVTGFFNGSPSKGVEFSYNSLLGGRDKRITQQRWFDTFIGKKADGANVELALDPNAQQVAFERLKTTERRAGAAVMDVKTGAVKVLASFPSYDPNLISPQAGDKGGKKLLELDKGRGSIKPLIDNAMSQTFPPGSTFKTVTAAIAMEQQGLTINSTVQTGALTLPESGRDLPNSHDSGSCAGQAPLRGAFAESCNTTFGRLAMDMGIEALNQGSSKFGFNRKVLVEQDLFAAESDVPVEVKDAKGQTIRTGKDGTARSGIGQENVRATPLQMAMVAAAVANQGKIMQPYLVEKVRAKDQSELYSVKRKEFAQPIKAQTADDLAEMMRAVVSEGTAKNLQPFNIAGKTGTAEQDGAPNARWFVGFAPAQNPRYAFAVMTEGTGSGGEAAGPIAGAIMQAVARK